MRTRCKFVELRENIDTLEQDTDSVCHWGKEEKNLVKIVEGFYEIKTNWTVEWKT